MFRLLILFLPLLDLSKIPVSSVLAQTVTLVLIVSSIYCTFGSVWRIICHVPKSKRDFPQYNISHLIHPLSLQCSLKKMPKKLVLVKSFCLTHILQSCTFLFLLVLKESDGRESLV